VGFWTCADDAAVSATDSSTWKVCARVSCPPEQDALVQAVTLCLTFGVMQSRVFPELVTANNNLALVAQARLAESALLSQIKAGSNQVTGGNIPTGMSFLRGLLNTVDRAVAYYRTVTASRRRPRCGRSSRSGCSTRSTPTWRSSRPRPPRWPRTSASALDEIQSFFDDRHINVTWTMDSPTPAPTAAASTAGRPGGGTDTYGAIPDFPTSLEWA
jgi:hypothetical protein